MYLMGKGTSISRTASKREGDAQDEVRVARQASEPVRRENHGLVAP